MPLLWCAERLPNWELPLLFVFPTPCCYFSPSCSYLQMGRLLSVFLCCQAGAVVSPSNGCFLIGFSISRKRALRSSFHCLLSISSCVAVLSTFLIPLFYWFFQYQSRNTAPPLHKLLYRIVLVSNRLFCYHLPPFC